MQEQIFSSERPIETLADDELGRESFAEAIAKIISQWRGRDSLVLAIYGPWGSGKSSIKNMILDALGKKKAKTILMEFNPWEWSGQDKVFDGFFTELAAKLGSSDKSKDAAKTAATMRMYGAMLSAAALLTRGFRIPFAVLLYVVGVFGIVPFFIQNPHLLSFLLFLGVASVVTATILAGLGTAADKLALYLSAKSDAFRKEVAEVRKELTALLRSRQTNILVVVDDIDRLTPDGIRMIFQLVKANGDFPNLVYLLLFQRDTIEKALSRTDGDGAQFLDKVVQVGFDIPKLNQEKLEETLESVVRAVVQESPADIKFDSQRWGQLFLLAIRPYFKTLRDIKRFGNTLAFHFQLYVNGTSFDANPVDLIALETLRQFEPLLYQKLHGAAELLTGRTGFPFDVPQGRKKEIEAWFERANLPDCARHIIEELFPPAASALADSEETARSNFTDKWFRDLRVCHPDVFERYFRFSLCEEDLPEAELDSILAASGDQERLVGKFKELNGRGLLRSAIARLSVDGLFVSSQNAIPFTSALFDAERELFTQTTRHARGEVPLEGRAIFIIHSILRKEPVAMRGEILRECIVNSAGLFLPIMIIKWPNEKGEQDTDIGISEQDGERLQKLCINKIRAAAETPELLTHPKLRHLLSWWSRWGSMEEATAWVKAKITSSDADLTLILGAFSESAAELKGTRTVNVRYRFAIEEFSRYMEPVEIADRVRQLSVSSDKDRQFPSRLFLLAFQQWESTNKGSLASGGPLDRWEWTTIDHLMN
jgi:predicted KAP-like P-loop ATPase